MKYYLLHIKDNFGPILHGPLKTEIAMELKEEQITESPEFSLIEDDERRADSLICLAVTGHGEIVRATSREYGAINEELEGDESDIAPVPIGTEDEDMYAPV
jgi:hypothetical protein